MPMGPKTIGNRSCVIECYFPYVNLLPRLGPAGQASSLKLDCDGRYVKTKNLKKNRKNVGLFVRTPSWIVTARYYLAERRLFR
jgi:hypothetical protein